MIYKFMIDHKPQTGNDPEGSPIREAKKQELGDELIKILDNVNITWLSDGTAVVSCESNKNKIKSTLKNMRLRPLNYTRSDILHRKDENANEPPMTNLMKKDLD